MEILEGSLKHNKYEFYFKSYKNVELSKEDIKFLYDLKYNRRV